MSVRERLIGTWNLVSYETRDADGRVGRPYGDAVGRINYDAAGHMSGQVMRPNRGSADAFAGYIAYFGTFDVDPDERRVVHHVRGALAPAWVGGDQVRGVRFDGERLVLSTETRKGDRTIHHELTWERAVRDA
jgi:hypothetical protein